MSEPELPKPIYPPSSPGATGTGGWGAPPTAPGIPAPPSEPPPAGGGFGGYGTGGGPGGGSGGFPPGPPSPSTAGKSKGPIIAIVAVAVVVVLGVIGVVVADSGDDKSSNTEQSNGNGNGGSGSGNGTKNSVPIRPGSTIPGSGGGDSASAVATRVFAGLSSTTIDCLAGELEQSDEVLAEIADDAVISIDDPDAAAEYASMLVGCTDVTERNAMLQSFLTGSMPDQAAAGCVLSNAEGFGEAQWEEFITASVQPSEASYVSQLLAQLSVC